MKIAFKAFLLIVVLFQYGSILSHGFVGRTLVSLQNNQNLLPIKDISSKFFKGQKTTVDTYKEKSKQWKTKPVQAVAHCQSNAFFELDFASSHKKPSEKIACSPLQLFYRMSDQAWIPAHELRDGDVLFCNDNKTTTLQSTKQVSETITLYIIEVKKHHTFAVGNQKILTHNIFIPIATTIGMSVPFDIVFGAGTFGCMFGPVSFCCSIAVAGVAAAIMYQCGKKKHTDFTLTCESVRSYDFRPVACDDIVSQSIVTLRCDVGPCELPVAFSYDRFAFDPGNTHKATVEDILNDAQAQGNTGGISKIYEKPGTCEDMIKDFDSLGLGNQEKFKDSEGQDGKTGFLPDGRKVTARITSSDERPTLEITPLQNSDNKKIKIRYGDKSDDNK